jgi:hypothetical protein
MKNMFQLIIFLLIPYLSFGQIIIGGRVSDAKTGEAIPFVNVGISGSSVGTVSDETGYFKLSIPQSEADSELSFSSIGYEGVQRKVSDFAGNTNLKVTLVPNDYNIEEVVVEDKSYFPYLLLKRAADNIEKNYGQSSYNYRLFYDNVSEKYNSEKRSRRAIVLLYDSEGYKRNGFYESFVNRNYKFLESDRNFTVRFPDEGTTKLDDLLTFDIVRSNGNVLDSHHKSDFEVSISEETILRGDSVWVLEYSCKAPKVVNTGFYYAESYSGKIYIAKKSYAVLKNETQGTVTHISNLGRGLYIPETETKQHISDARYSFSTEYIKAHNNTYRLGDIHYQINASNSASSENSIRSVNAKLKVLDCITQEPEQIEERDYFENISYNHLFWSDFSVDN